MCHIKSMIVLKNRVYCPLDHDHHTKMLEELGIRDDSISPDFVRVEMVPKDGDIFNHNRENWKFKVNQDLLPDWFMLEDAEQACWEQLEKWFSKRLIREGHHKISGGRWFVCGDAFIAAVANTIVYAQDNVNVYAWDNVTVYACGNVTVVARDNVAVYACDNVTVVAWDSTKVEIWCNVIVDASSNVKIRARGNAMINISGGRSSGVKILKLQDFAIVRDMRSNPPILLTANTFEVKKFEDAACV